MVYKHFNIKLSLKIGLLTASAVLLGLSVSGKINVWLSAVFAVLTIASAVSLIRFMNSTNRQITYFISAIRNSDTTLKFPTRTDNKIIGDLHESLNELNLILQDAKINSQLKDQYFSKIIEHIGVGVLVFDEKNFVTNANQSAISLFGLQVITHLSQIAQIDSNFSNMLASLGDNTKQVLPLNINGTEKSIMSQCSVVSLSDKSVHLVTLQDIHAELERKEADAWKKLIRVLSHEIMNSLTPITSIAQTLESQWNSSSEISEDTIRNSIGGLSVISERCSGLAKFVQSYRVLTNIPKPVRSSIGITSLFERFSIFTSPMKAQYGVDIRFIPPKADFTVNIDEQMFMQVIINLVKNASEALANSQTKNPFVEVSALRLSSGETEITVKDNGPGIPESIRNEIFVPFFTTKETGSGIGLSYSQQVLRAHGGSISCQAGGDGTVMRLVF